MKQSVEREKTRRVDRQRQQRQARELAAQGRGNDTEVAHVARGEFVVPQALQTPEVLAALQRAAAPYGVALEMLSVGHAMNSINPATGAPEFGVIDWVSGLFKDNAPKSPPFIPIPNVDNAATPTFESLGFDPHGPGQIGATFRDPIGAWTADRARRRAKSEAWEKYKDNPDSLVDGEGDAWRHGRWMQLMAHELGPMRANKFGDAHEISTWDQNTPGERLMDIYNNRVAAGLPSDPRGHMNPDVALQNALAKGYLRKSPFTR